MKLFSKQRNGAERTYQILGIQFKTKSKLKELKYRVKKLENDLSFVNLPDGLSYRLMCLEHNARIYESYHCAETKKVKVAFGFPRMIIGGVEKVFIQLLDELIATQRYEIAVILKNPDIEPYFLDILLKHKIPLKTINDASDYDVILDYHSCSCVKELSHIEREKKIGFTHCGIKAFLRRGEITPDSYVKLISPTDSFCRDLLAVQPAYQNCLMRIYNPFDIERIKRMALNAPVPTDEKYFVFVARMDIDKDHLTVIKAFEKFAQEHNDSKMYFVGDGPLRAQWEQEIKNRWLQDKIILTGTLENPYGYIKNAVANILSSPSEGLPTVLIEGIILETLNIASDCPNGPAEILSDGQGGILFPVGDVSKLADIMEKVWTGKTNTQQMIDYASSTLNRFEVKTIMPEIEKIIQETAENVRHQKGENV